jgi:protein gp37
MAKRSEHLLKMDASLKWENHIWVGVSVENADYTYRIDHLRQPNAKVKFISFEPLIGGMQAS